MSRRTTLLAAALGSACVLATLGRAPVERAQAIAAGPCPFALIGGSRPVAPPRAPAATASFVDPTAVVRRPWRVRVGRRVFVAPFARLEAGVRPNERICVEDGADLQDNTVVRPRGGPARVGAEAIVAHGAMLVGAGREVSIAHRSACPLPSPGRDPAALASPAPAAGRRSPTRSPKRASGRSTAGACPPS